MRLFGVGLLALALLGGCNSSTKANTPRPEVTESSLLAAMGNPPVPQRRSWTALDLIGNQPPMEGPFMNAMADPFDPDAEWAKPNAKNLRTDMLAQQKKWWSQMPGKAGEDLEDNQIATRLSVIISSRILMARLMALDPQLSSQALKTSVETMRVAREGFQTAPGMINAELMPSVVMAAEAMVKIAEEVGGTPEDFKAAAKELDFSIFDGVALSVNEDFYFNQVPQLILQLNSADQSAEIVRLVDPMGEGDSAILKIEAALKGNQTISLDETATLLKTVVAKYQKAPSNFSEFAQMSRDVDDSISQVWGENIFEVRPENWDENMHDPVEESKNPAGVIFVAALERRWLSMIESSYVMQMSLDAARVRLSKTMLARDIINDNESKIIDRLTGLPYDVDMNSEVLRTTLKNVDPTFIFVNQIVQQGMPLYR